MSIFQGVPSIHVDNNQQRIEEEEAISDQLRRNAEVNKAQNLLETLPKKSFVYFVFLAK